jgi:1-acyl-sn-glycerol-3-phosphate acyltransferase
MAQKTEKPSTSSRVVSTQTLSSMIDEGLFSLFKVFEAVGLGNAFKQGTWSLATTGLREVLKNVFSLKVQGRENIPASGPAITCVKTTTGAYPFFAWVAVAESQNRMLHQAFDIEFFKMIGLRSALIWLDSIEVTDAQISAPRKETILKNLMDNELVGLSLEHVKREGETETNVPALDTIEIATRANVPIIPIQIDNAEGVIDIKSRKVSLNQKITITILPPYTKHLDQKKPAKDCIKELIPLLASKV